MKHFYTLAFLLAIAIATSAQTPWYLTGNTPGLNDFLGSTGTQHVNFRTNNQQHMTIKGSNTIGGMGGNNFGWVGIGPVTDPHSMLHIGQNCIMSGTNTGGWRSWMRFGTFVCNENDDVFFGLKQNEHNSTSPDRQDAVIAWGDNNAADGTSEGPDVFRVLFIGHTAQAAPAGSADGLELARFEPDGHVGIGNFQPLLTQQPTATLDVNGTARVRNLPAGTGSTVVADASGNLLLGAAPTSGTVNSAQNATWITGTNNDIVEWGTNPLMHDTEIPMIDGNGDEWNVYFSGQSELQNGSANVGIGYNMPTPLLAKLDVFSNTDAFNGNTFTNQFAGRFLNRGDYPAGSGTTNFFGVRGSCSVISNLNQNTNFGGDFLAVNNTRTNVGVEGRATVANFTDYAIIARNIGVRGTASQTDCNFGYAFGVHGTAAGGEYAMGVVGEARRASRLSIGVYGGITEECGPSFAGYFTGAVVNTQAPLVPSDQNLKDNIEALTPANAMEIINALQPKTYTYKTNDFPSMALAQGQQLGFLAQELGAVLPGAVKDCIHPPVLDSLQNIVTPEIEFKAINYDALIPVMVAAIQELKQQNEELAAQLQQCCLLDGPAPLAPQQQDGEDETGSRQQGVELSNYAIILDQNSPNPFAEQTSIGYTIPQDVKDAKIMFYDNSGRVLKVVSIADRGTNSLVVYASNLSSGSYTYSLIADGRLIDTKKMTCQK